MNTIPSDSPIALNDWARSIGVTRVTIWRWRKCGLINTVNIFGRQYITAKEIQKFTERAAAGEFHKLPVVPRVVA